MTIGERIKQIRKEKGWSMSKLSTMSNLPGGRQHIYKLEHGVILPSILTINKIAMSLDIHPSELLKL